jgi:uncharacterized protein
MSRLIFIVLVIVLIIYLFKRKALPKNPLDASRSKKNATSKTGEAMVKCKTCGVHLPISEALKKQEDYFCSSAHLPPE